MAETCSKSEINLFYTTTGINTGTAEVSFDFEYSWDFLIPGNEKKSGKISIFKKKKFLKILKNCFEKKILYDKLKN